MSTASPSESANLPIYTRKATGMVREIPMLDQSVFNATSGPPVGVIIFGLFALLVFPQSNIYVTAILAPVFGVFVWATFALMAAAMPRLGGDYTYNTRVLKPWIGLAANIGGVISPALGAGLWATFMATQGLSPALSVIGVTTGSSTLVHWGADFSPTHRTTVFIVGVASLGIMSILSYMGTKVAMRFITVLFLIGVGGLAISFAILLFTSHSSFVSTVNHVGGPNAYQKTVAAAHGKGLYPSEGGYSSKATLGALYYWSINSIWLFWGTYTASEFKGGGRRRRQLWAMVGTGVIQSVIVILIVVVFLHTIGYNFFVSSLAGNFAPSQGLVGSAGYAYFTALIAGNTAIVSLLALAFLGWWLPGQYINLAMVQRALMTWSLDGLLPGWVSKVDARRHTPHVAIGLAFIATVATAALASYYASFSQIFALIALFGYMPILFVGISALLIKYRRPDLYKGSQAEWYVGGIEVLPIVGAACTIIGGGLIFLTLYFHEALGIKHFHATEGLGIGLFVLAAVWYLGAKAVRKRQGIDIGLAYRVIPPE
jgi:basic amino acid/polyamine antiporter, APA family